MTTAAIGFTELALIAGVLLFFFGAKRLPEIARGLGSGIRGFKAELREPDPAERERRLPPEDPDAPRS